MLKLSPRLQLISDHLIPGEALWDLCCDHGYLGLAAYDSGLFTKVYFVDQVASIMNALEKRFKECHFAEAIKTQASFLCIPGQDIAQPVSGTLVIAGIGGLTSLDIVRGLHKGGHLQASRIIFSPHKAMPTVRHFFIENPSLGYVLSPDEPEIRERGRIRKLLIFDKI